MSPTVTPTPRACLTFSSFSVRGPELERCRTFIDSSFLEIQTLVDKYWSYPMAGYPLTAKAYLLVRVPLLYHLLQLMHMLSSRFPLHYNHHTTFGTNFYG